MYPDRFEQQPQGIDYLNQIATPPPAEGFDKKTKLSSLFWALSAITLIAIFVFHRLYAKY